MQVWIDRIKVILRAAPTWITLAIAVLTTLAATLEAEGMVEVARYLVIVIGWLTGAISIIRRVTPVDANERGILPQ